MNKLTEIFKCYETITDSYMGDETDWKQKSYELKLLVEKLKVSKPRYGKNGQFYHFIYQKMLNEIEEEYSRVCILCNVK